MRPEGGAVSCIEEGAGSAKASPKKRRLESSLEGWLELRQGAAESSGEGVPGRGHSMCNGLVWSIKSEAEEWQERRRWGGTGGRGQGVRALTALLRGLDFFLRVLGATGGN